MPAGKYLRTPEIRLKISLTKKGKKLPALSHEHKRKLSEGRTGKKHWMFGKHLTEEHKKKISNSEKGRTHSEETRRKMSISAMGKKGTFGNLGHNHSMVTRQKIKDTLKQRFPNGRKDSIETRLKKSNALKGEKNIHWKGGITETNKAIRNSFEMKQWKRDNLARDDYKCIWCGSKKNLQIDHIKPFSLFPELRFELSNGRTLCKECHTITDSYLGNFNKNYKSI